MRRILVIDDEPKICRLIGEMLEAAGYEVDRCSTAAEARGRLEGEVYDVVVSDVRLPDGSGVELVRHARETAPALPVILITAYAAVPQAVEAMRLGAFDYVQKPFDMDALRLLVERALESTRLREELQVLRADNQRHRAVRRLVGDSPAMRHVRELVAVVAPTPTTVLVQGESGVGKELVAESIHALGQGASRPLVRVNCLAIPPELMESELFGHVRGAFTGAHANRRGWFELAQGGTLFLDEIADLPATLQGKLLRALEERRITRVGGNREIAVDARLVVASNADLAARVEAGRFRADLFYRLNVFPITVPPLRERVEDIPSIGEALLEDIARRLGRPVPGVTSELFAALEDYDWPGNVRELRNVLERAAVLAGGDPLGVQHLPGELFARTTDAACTPECFNDQLEQFQTRVLLEALRASGWVKKNAARKLGLSPRAMSYYIAKHRLESYRTGDEPEPT